MKKNIAFFIGRYFSRSASVLLATTLISMASYGYTVTGLEAICQNGQVFITWTNAKATNLQYNIYRSSSRFTSADQLTQASFMGFVRDSSSKNFRLSQGARLSYFYKIKDNGNPLNGSQGLYVVTCTERESFYYAVTVTNLSTHAESKIISIGKNTLASPLAETVEKPQPVYQDSVITSGNEVKLRYVQFGNNQETTLFPALTSVGSYGFNFYMVKRGHAARYPLFVVYEGIDAKAEDGTGIDESIENCCILGFDDWLPIPDGKGGIGDNTYFSAYHEKFNIYSNDNPVPSSGTIKAYPQKRCIEAIRWAKKNYPVDPSQVYLKGSSATGFGSILTALLYPNEVAAVYAMVEPTILVPSNSSDGDIYKQMWGLNTTDLPTDIINPQTGGKISIYSLLDLKKMISCNRIKDVPPVYDVHGKNDVKVVWSKTIIAWYDSLQSNHVGGAFYWDERTHDGNKKDFLNDETMPNFLRFKTSKSYPAFSNCSINQDPGDGTPAKGADFGAINGYLDFDDDITDNKCNYEINLNIKTLYVGGVKDPEQYSNCYADITLRRVQNFRPAPGSIITWINYSSTNEVLQNGSFTYGGGLLTVPNLRINKSGSRLDLTISGCQRDESFRNTPTENETVQAIRVGDSYELHITMDHAENTSFYLFNILGQLQLQQQVSLEQGTNVIKIPAQQRGPYIFELKGENFSHSEKLLF